MMTTSPKPIQLMYEQAREHYKEETDPSTCPFCSAATREMQARDMHKYSPCFMCIHGHIFSPLIQKPHVPFALCVPEGIRIASMILDEDENE